VLRAARFQIPRMANIEIWLMQEQQVDVIVELEIRKLLANIENLAVSPGKFGI